MLVVDWFKVCVGKRVAVPVVSPVERGRLAFAGYYGVSAVNDVVISYWCVHRLGCNKISNEKPD